MSRLDTIKRVGFPPEKCPACNGDGDCEHCDDGIFTQRVSEDWEPPQLAEGQFLDAYLDVDHWPWIGIADADGEVRELEFPFATTFATPQHFETLGFHVST